jgi:IgGFc binding protein
MSSRNSLVGLALAGVLACTPAACGPSNGGRHGPGNGNGDLGGGGDAGGGGGNGDGGGGGTDDAGYLVGDPTTCADAAANKTYIGCDYWPTVVGNQVWSIFDYAVVVSNPGTTTATVTVTGPNSTNQMAMVPPNQLVTIYLPWVSELKGPDQDDMTAGTPLGASVVKTGGAYHLVSTVPVVVYQFNALEYQGMGGPPGKSWASCPGTSSGTGCFSFTNDASLLLPSTAMTGNYRVFTEHGLDGFPGLPPIIPAEPGMPGYFAITATQDGTMVTIQVTSQILAGGSVTAINAGQTETFMLNAGDVAEVVSFGAAANDLSGSQVQATKPVQVIGGIQCIANPTTDSACDHLEETVMPTETLGKDYVVTVPTGPNGTPVGQTVRFIGNVDGTKLTYNPSISGAPATINAGQVVELGNVAKDFEVTGDHEFIVSTISLSAQLADPTGGQTAKGDPAMSVATAVEQYRLKYVFLAPEDYDVNYVDIVAPMGANLMLDGAAVTQSPSAIGTTMYGVYRVKLTAGMSGAHQLSSDQPIGIQVSGYGSYTSYQYPGGLNLRSIAPTPTPIG